jgi:NTE family protein
MPPSADSSRAQPLSLALSGGGAKCAAQIGVLSVLDEAKLPVGALAGTSGGGMVSILYGLGYSPHAILDYFASTHLLEVWDLDPDRRALFGTEKIRTRIRSMVGDKTFADLKIPVTAVAADMVTKREVDINSGALEEAVRATMAIPVLFAPVVRGNVTLVDGGIFNPLPVDVARRQGPRVVAVDVLHDSFHTVTSQIFEARGPMRYANEVVRRLGMTAMLDSANDAVAIFSLRLIELNLRLHPADVLLQPAVGSVGLFAFDLAHQAFQAGEAAARAALPELEALAHPSPRSRLASAWRRVRKPG